VVTGERTGRNRGQLILVGSLTLAFIIVSLAVVFNGLAFADTLSRSGAGERLDDASRFDRSAVDGSRDLVLYVNHAAPYGGQAALNDSVAKNLTTYSDLRAESHAASRPGYVRVRYRGVDSHGTRVVQTADGNFTADGTPSGTADWNPVDTKRELGWFVVNLDARNVSATSGADRFRIELTDDDGDTGILYVSRNTSTGADAATIDVETDLPGTTNDTARRACAPSQDRLLLNLRAGQAFGGYCEFNLTGPLDAPYEVRFENGKKATGKYAVVVDQSPSPGPNSLGVCPEPTGPCNAWVVWSAELTTVYETRDVSHRHTRNVTVYP
jgi:hypothetical protein